jgi:Protein of unknown function (DUF3592)
MVYRYQNALRDDDGLRQKLQFLRPMPRRLIPIALACICAVPLLLARLERGVGRYVFIFFGCLVASLFAARFVHEYRVVRNWSTAVGTVLLFRKSGHRRGARIKYAFRGSDGLVHLGSATGSVRLPKEGATLGIVYRSDDPSQSLLLSQFWFYEFSQVEAREQTEPSEIHSTES